MNTNAPITFTDAAAAKVLSLLQEEENPNMMLRVYIQGGGCSGFSYGFTFEEKLEDGDLTVENGGVTLVVDPMSVQYLIDAEIDYTESLAVSQFIIRNPQATTTCGCGSSFAA